MLRISRFSQVRKVSILSEFVSSIRRQIKEDQAFQKDIKQLASEREKVVESEAMKNAQKAISQTSQATKKVLNAVGDVVEQTMETPVVKATGKAIYKTAEVVVDISQKVAEPIKETTAYKVSASGIKQIKKDVVGTTRNAYWAEYRPKEVRDEERKEMLKENQYRIQKDEHGLPLAQGPVKADEESSGIVMHRSSRIAQAWENFKSESLIGKTLHSYKKSIDESEAPILRMWREWKERSIANEPESVKVIKAFKSVDPMFDQHNFLKEAANFLIADILDAYLKGDVKVLREWGTEGAFARLTADFEAQKQAGLVSDCKLIDYRQVELSKLALIEDEVPVAILTFTTTEILCFRNKKGEIKLGAEDNIQNARYSIAFTKKQILEPDSELNPETNGWIIIDWARSAF